MECSNCNKPIPEGANRCLYCESDQGEMADLTHEEMEAAATVLQQVMPGGLEQIRAMAGNFETAEDFANAIFVGACPACDSTDVGTFGEVAGIEDPTVARCFACGHL
jgi:hypothetical protein